MAAFANSGGGVIVFGIEETQRKATGRLDIGDVSESYERTLRRVAVSGIQPPVFNLDVVRVGDEGQRALVVVIPASVEVPHLIYKKDYFGAPIRNHADTEWMRERQLEALYRQRLDERRNSDRAVDDLFAEVADGRSDPARAWLVAVAYPRMPLVGRSLDSSQMRTLVQGTVTTSLNWAARGGVRPLEVVDRDNPRRGLRRWTVSSRYDFPADWRTGRMSVHDNGAVSVLMSAGGHRDATGEGWYPGGRVRSSLIEGSISDWLGMLWETAKATGIASEYDAVLGIVYDGAPGEARDPIFIETTDWSGHPFDGTSVPLARFTPVRTSLRLDVDKETYVEQVYEVACDALNQGGVQNVKLIPGPEEG